MSDFIPSLGTATAATVAGGLVYALYKRNANKSGVKTTPLRGPTRDNILLGQTKAIWGTPHAKTVIEGWVEEYGGMLLRPGPFGTSDIVVTDAKAAGYLLASSENVYHIPTVIRMITENMVGKGLIAADGESHKRQRKNISPGFTSVKIREYTSIFFDCAHQLETKWSTQLESHEDYVTDVQKWFAAYSLDAMGLAGFSHDFGALSSRPSDVSTAFDAIFASPLGLLDGVVFFTQVVFPPITSLPTKRQRAVNRLHDACGVLAKQIIEKSRAEEKGERSIMGLMVQAEEATSGVILSEEEVTSQIRTLILAGYETTSATLSWIFIELCRNLNLQKRVRAELLNSFPVEDPTYEELNSDLPLLDAVIHEVLRLHPPILETWRTAHRDDVIPLSTPVVLPNGELTDHIVIAKGQTVVVHLQVMNRAKQIWGPDAWEFNPDRWLSDLPERVQAVAAYRHLMTFLDGPKVCLGRSFAVTNIKVLLSVLLRKFSFELLDGPDTKIVEAITFVHRPKEEVVDGAKSAEPIVRMRVRAVE